MQSVSKLWSTLRAMPGTEVEWRFDINGVTYGPEAEVSHEANRALYTEFGFGNASCAGLTLQLLADNIPKSAKIQRFCRLVNGEQASEWIPAGVYFTSLRAEEDGFWEIEAFDNMRKAEKVWEPDQALEFPMPMDEAVAEICRVLGFTLDDRTEISHTYTLDYPQSDQTFRHTLKWIAAAHGGNWIFTPAGKLRLVPLLSAPGETHYLVDENGDPITFGGNRILVGDAEDSAFANPDGQKHFIGLDLFTARNNGKRKPVSRITLLADDENAYTAGDDTGLELVADCPYATQDMVDALLAKLAGYEYQAFSAEGANLDPAAELGDGISAGGSYFVLGSIAEDGTGYPDISAPGDVEREEEYPEGNYSDQSFNRKLATTRSLIKKTAEEVKISVEELGGKYTALAVTLDGVTITDPDGTTKIKGSSIETASLYVDAAHITGKLSANQVEIDLSGSIKWTDLSADVQNDINDAYAMAEDAEAAAADAADTVDAWRYNGGTYIDGEKIMAGTVIAGSLIGGEVALLTSAERTAGGLSITGATTSTYAIELWSYGALRLEASDGAVYLGGESASIEVSDRIWMNDHMYPSDPDTYNCGNANFPWAMVYSTNGMCETSDRKKKKNITYGLDRFDGFFDGLQPGSYQMVDGTSGRFHNGFIADDVKANLDKHGISTKDFGGYVADKDKDGNEILGLRYSEFIPLIVDQVQKLKARVAKMEEKKHEV